MIKIFRIAMLLLLFTACKEKLDKEQQKLVDENKEFGKHMNNRALDTTIKVERFLSGDTVPITALFKSEPTCVLQYSELNCNVCVDSAVNRFRQFAEKVGEEHAIIMAASDNKRYMASFMQMNKLRTNNVYLISNLDYEKLYKAAINKPFVYTTNQQLVMKDCFLPFKEIPQYSDDYYASLSNKYFHHDN